MRKLMIVSGLVVAAVLSSGPLTALADEQQKKPDSAEAKKDGKESKGETEDARDGINKAYDAFKKETTKGKKNLNELYQRSTSTQKDEKEK